MKNLICIALFFCLVGCTGYQKMGSGFWYGGYNELKLSNDTYAVEYASDSSTNHSTNFNYALRRAAEITKKNGFKYFIVKSATDTSRQFTMPIVKNTRSNAHGSSFGHYGYGTYNGFGNAYGTSTTTTSGGGTYTQPGIYIVIKMSKKKVAESYDANIILSNFKNKEWKC